MATRTIKFFGRASSNTGTANITFNFNNQEVFNGNIPASTVESASDVSLVELFTFDVDRTLAGDIPASFTSVVGNVYVIGLTANHTTTADGQDTTYQPVENDEQVAKFDIAIDGEEFTENANPDDEQLGPWHVRVKESSTMTFTIPLSATYTIPTEATPL